MSWPDIAREIKGLKKANLYRSLESVSSAAGPVIRLAGREFVNLSSNNYLGLARHPQIIRKTAQALRRWGTGSGASRLISGDLKIHADLEEKLARFKKEEAASVFSSGYLAALGAVTALLNEKDLVLADRLNHASLIDAARLSRAKLWVYPHKNAAELSRLLAKAGGFRRKLVVTDAYFSMDGDVAPLDELLELCERQCAVLVIDEAHSTGVFGRSGRGLTEQFHLEGKIPVVMGTLSKALGSVGGFIAGKRALKETLHNFCRAFIYTTAPSPSASASAMEALGIIEKHSIFRKKLWENIRFLREALTESGFDLMGSEGPIIPIQMSDSVKTLRFRDQLKKEGFIVSAIRPPTVPRGTDRLRLSVSAAHSKAQMTSLVRAMKKMGQPFR